MTTRWLVFLVGLCMAAAALAQPPQERRGSQGRSAQYPQQKPVLGDPAPDFTLTDLEGKSLRLGDLLGKRPVVLEFGSYT